MAVSPAEQVLSATPFGGRVICGSLRSGMASYDGFGRRFVYLPPETTEAERYRYAMDVESRQTACPELISAAVGEAAETALRGWTELEVLAKLTTMPVHLLLRVKDVRITAGIEIIRCDTETHWIAVGMKER